MTSEPQMPFAAPSALRLRFQASERRITPANRGRQSRQPGEEVRSAFARDSCARIGLFAQPTQDWDIPVIFFARPFARGSIALDGSTGVITGFVGDSDRSGTFRYRASTIGDGATARPRTGEAAATGNPGGATGSGLAPAR